jgi:hypothetical protein
VGVQAVRTVFLYETLAIDDEDAYLTRIQFLCVLDEYIVAVAEGRLYSARARDEIQASFEHSMKFPVWEHLFELDIDRIMTHCYNFCAASFHGGGRKCLSI